MARTTGTASVGDLLERGVIEPNERIEVRRRSAPAVRATVATDGRIRVDGRLFGTPSAAARHALGAAAADGWLRWRVPRLGGRTLAELRDDR